MRCFFYYMDSSVKFQKLLQAVTIPRCISILGLKYIIIKHLQSGQMLQDTRMMQGSSNFYPATASSTAGTSANTSLSK